QQQVVDLGDGHVKKIETIGDKWSAFQIANFGATAQPEYAIIDAGGKLLTRTKFYTDDAEAFRDWLQCGVEAFRIK
ncbi:MAG: hypothetical protein RL750_729, partial [Bacteroidota bacterium]